jgi:O-acetyl-ADP-ribose deacetylase (regulator of RNase III)
MSDIKFEVLLTDITTLDVDVIVNAANRFMRGGSGVDGAMHVAAGPQLLEYTWQFGECETGDVRVSPGFDLSAKHIIHAVGPIWHGGENQEEKLLRSCYTKSIEEAVALGAKSIAFPAISTGVYGYPKLAAAKVAASAVKGALAVESGTLERIVFAAFSLDDYEILSKAVL